ncbi:hypothetical protein [Massilia sp. X63]|jgi:hypothetical protein|uniref:hypothetical protein n=1 Tax=Massilia sp. X63 TaxID=3237285 RepID=UPI0034DD9115
MNKQIVRVMDKVEEAERARQALLDAGFDRDGIEISHTGDEAGPAEANFTVGDSPAVKGGTDYKDVYSPGLEISSCVITVTADESRLDKAASILEYYGAKDNDPAHR